MTKEDLQAAIEQFEDEAYACRRAGNETGYNDRMTEANKLRQQLSEIEANEHHEVRVQASQEKVAYIFDNLTIMDMPVRSFFKDEESYQLVRIEVQQEVNSHVEGISAEFASVEASQKQQIEAERVKTAKLQEQYDLLFEDAAELKRTIEQLRAANEQLKLEKADAENKRDAAASEVEGMKMLVEEKDAHIEQLRVEIANGVRNQMRTITPEEIARQKEEAQRKWLESRVKIVNKRWESDLRKTHYLAERVDNGETVRIPFMEIGQFLEVTDEEAARFRAELAEQAAKEAAESGTEDSIDPPLVEHPAPPALPVQQFLEEGDIPGTDSESVDGTLADAAVTRQEFEALKERVRKNEVLALNVEAQLKAYEQNGLKVAADGMNDGGEAA